MSLGLRVLGAITSRPSLGDDLKHVFDTDDFVILAHDDRSRLGPQYLPIFEVLDLDVIRRISRFRSGSSDPFRGFRVDVQREAPAVT